MTKDKKTPPHGAGASLPSRGGREAEKLFEDIPVFGEDLPEFDEKGFPLIHSGGPVQGMRKGDTWHRKK